MPGAVLEVTPAQAVEQLTNDLELSKNELSHALNVTPRTLDRWTSGEAHPQREARQRLATLLDFDYRLREVFRTPEASNEWLRSENRYLGALTPLEVARAGRIDRLEAALEALSSGVFI